MSIFVIEDVLHAEWCGEFPSYEEAMQELKKRSKLPWDAEPNRCPCTSWKTCKRSYEIIEFDDSNRMPWVEISRRWVLSISSEGVVLDDEPY
jgi:hypothetical protein